MLTEKKIPDSFRPLAFVQDTEVYYYHLDHLGTPQEITDAQGEIVWSVRYKAYGNVIRKEVEVVENNLRFQGQYFDKETGLHYNRFRYYDPDVGRFIHQDPIGLVGGDNLYLYVPNPINWLDPFGLISYDDIPNNYNWKGHLERVSGTRMPSTDDMYRPHAHHIVFKKGSRRQRPILEQSKAILEKYDIDWLYGPENLIWAPNKNHSGVAAERVLDALRDADQNIGTKEGVVAALREIGDRFADDTICD